MHEGKVGAMKDTVVLVTRRGMGDIVAAQAMASKVVAI
jgi:hypothetical protein